MGNCVESKAETVNIRNSAALRKHLQVPKLEIQSVAASGFLHRFNSQQTEMLPSETVRQSQKLAGRRKPSPVLKEKEFVVVGKAKSRGQEEGSTIGQRERHGKSMMTSFYQGMSGMFEANFTSAGARLFGLSYPSSLKFESTASNATGRAVSNKAKALPRRDFRRRLRRKDVRFSYTTGGAARKFQKKKGKYIILSLDGGGIRGITTLQLIKRIEARFPGFLASVDMFAGSSTGGITAAYLATGGTPEEAINVYVRMAPDLFSVKTETRQADTADITGVRGITRPKSDGLVMKDNLKSVFRKLKLGEVKKRLVVPCFALRTQGGRSGRRKGVDMPGVIGGEVMMSTAMQSTGPRPRNNGMGSWKTVIYDTKPTSKSEDKRDTLVVDMLMGTCAAPSYFPPYRGMIDGSLVSNNPTMIAITQALSTGESFSGVGAAENEAIAEEKKRLFPRREDLVIISLSTGSVHQAVGEESQDWGLAQWVAPIINILFHTSSEIIDRQASELFRGQYIRVHPKIRDFILIDEVDKMPELADSGLLHDLGDCYDFIESKCLDKI